MRNINLNQFALPGMEEHAHPGARHLAKGVSFHTSHDFTYNTPPGEEEKWRQYRQPHSHMMYASGQHGETLGELHWAGSGQQRKSEHSGHYPGEITWVQSKRPLTKNNPTGAIYEPTKSGNWRKARNPHKGLMTDMLKMAHGMNFGQSTVPVHSPDRTREGEEWATKVGPEHLTPKRFDFDWRPPAGTHPYEQKRNLSQRQFSKPPEGQQHLPGMSRADDIWWDVK